MITCSDSFNPVREGESRMIVYSVLDATSDIQYVRVYRNYYPAENNPLNNDSAKTSCAEAWHRAKRESLFSP